MAFHVSFIVGLVVLAYLSTFIVFAVIRVLFGVSIQRLWYSGLRRISFTPRDGLRIDIRGLRLSIHRPTFARPTWLSIVITELKVTLDLKALGNKPAKKRWPGWGHGNGAASRSHTPPRTPTKPTAEETEVDETEAEEGEDEQQRSRTWQRLTQYKERIKRLHRQIQWIRLVDLVANNSSLVILDVGTFQLSSFTMAVDTRRKTVDRSRLFQHRKAESDLQQPAEWILSARNLLFAPDGDEANEMLDHATLNVHGLLSQRLEGLRDASIALKLGRVSLPYDDLMLCKERSENKRKNHSRRPTGSKNSETSFREIMEELERPGSQEEAIVQTVSDSKEFVASILRGIQEIQFAVGFIGLSKRIRTRSSSKGKVKAPIYLNMSMKEVGLDVLRLESGSPAHLTYFSRDDVAHQALLTAISISAGIDDGHDHPERLFYVPMATATIKSTLPSKTIQISKQKNVADRNTNILFANLVVTSPSIDLDPKHLPLILSILRSQRDRPRPRSPVGRQPERHRLISRLLPKASVKISVHEPVIRVSLPCMDVERRGTGEFDLLISANSSISLDLESSHSAGTEFHYSLTSIFRIASHHFYYQTAAGERHNLLVTESLELKAQMSASPQVAVVVSGNAQTFSIYMLRPEISEGVRLIVAQMRADVLKRGPDFGPEPPNFLRKLPPWLLHVQMSGSDFNVEVAGVDSDISDQPRGVALHLESWTADYKANRHEEAVARPIRRRATSRSITGDDVFLRPLTPNSPRRSYGLETDNRRLAVHLHGMEAFIIDSTEMNEPESFMSLPRFEVAFSTSTDHTGPLLHINAIAKALYMHYSLYRHFALGMVGTVLRKTFAKPDIEPTSPSEPFSPLAFDGEPMSPPRSPNPKPEVVTIDVKAHLVQLKAKMPSDPSLMLQVFGFEAGRHRWATPFARARLMRLYADTPNVPGYWSRVVSIRGARVDYRQSKRKFGTGYVDEKSIDVVSEAIRVGVPHQLVVHKIFDNIVNVVKTSEQLHHRFKTGTDEYILAKKPEGPKKVPKVNVRTQAFLFEIEDGAFDWKLGVIYLQGLQEQKQRLAREEAFRLKVKRIQEAEARSGAPRHRAKSAHPARGRYGPRTSQDVGSADRSRSASAAEGERPESHGSDRRLRYDVQGTCGMSETAKRNIEDARAVLDQYNAQSWKRRIDNAYNFQHHGIRDLRNLVWGLDDAPEDAEQKEKIMATNERPALMAVLVSDLSITIDKPSFPLHDYPNFLHNVGKGMPLDMQYSLLIPMHVNIQMGEARCTLKDYPLPVLHVPAIRPGQSPRLASLALTSDFVIAEEFRNEESIRHVEVMVVPQERDASGELRGGMTVDVRRTVSAVKTYSKILVDINTSSPTRITWGSSYQPAIQDMMQVIENFTKPPVDTSERVGFWDKIRLAFHSSIQVSWKGDGDVNLVLKGSRDPYSVTGSGAGFVMCWRNDVVWRIAQDNDPRKVMTVDSGEYVLAIPDFSRQARRNYDRLDGTDSSSINSSSSVSESGKFKKTIMKLSGNVQWLAGLVFERNKHNGARSFHFKPHYEVVLKDAKFAKEVNGKPWDAFHGFRSQHIHLSVAIAAPHNRDWTVTNSKPASNYNSVHLTPRFFSHFFDWWSMFSGVMSLPIRQGKLFPGVEKSSKKFARHLATIKYNLLLSPLYLAHMYKHKDAEEYGKNFVFATGLKMKLDSFMLDLHQRRETFKQLHNQGELGKEETTTTAMRINQAQLDFMSTDIRAVSARIVGTDVSDIEHATDDTLASFEQSVPKADLSCFTIPDNDTGWVDMDDFVEMDWTLPAEPNPETKILPLAFAPRFTYFRNTDHQGVINGDPNRSSVFGQEPTHYCVMSQRNDPRRVQCDLIQSRLDKLEDQIAQNIRTIGDVELRLVKAGSEDDRVVYEARLQAWREHHDTLQKKLRFLQSMHKTLLSRLNDGDRRAVPDHERDVDDAYYDTHEEYDPTDPEVQGMDSAPLSDDISDFNNRFIVHNAQVKWNNSLRDIILRYIHQVSQRRGYVYYMSRRAVKFILDIVEEQKKASANQRPDIRRANTDTSNPLTPQVSKDDELEVQDRIAELLKDVNRVVTADDPDYEDRAHGHKHTKSSDSGEPDDEISHNFASQNAYHVRLIAPQIQLQSEKNMKAAVLVTSKGMQLKVIQIMDKDRLSDEVSGLVQRRFTAGMDSVQIFVTSLKSFAPEFLRMYSGNKYGTKAGTSWPPWVPLEVMFDFNIDPFGFQRVVERTSVRMRYDKFNTLRLKYNDDVTSGTGTGEQGQDQDENRIDHVWVNFPQFHAICDSQQYYAMYIMVLDLLLYSEPLEKTRREKLEKIMLASDFSDLSDAPAMVMKLQDKIRTMQEIKAMFQINERSLNRQQWKERILLEHDLANCEDELFFIMKAITTSQRRADERASAAQTALLRWEIFAKELVWHLVREQQEHLVEMQISNAVFNRIDNNDGSNENTIEIGSVKGLNLLPDAYYPTIVQPFDETTGNVNRSMSDAHDTSHHRKRKSILTVHWLQLEAIAGIKVVERFEADVHPLKIEMEREVGLKVFEYIFPGSNASKGENGISPFNIKHMLPQNEDDVIELEGDETLPPEDLPIARPNDELTGAGDLTLRLTPTMNLADIKSRDKERKPTESHRDYWRSHFKKDHSATDLRKLALKTKKDDNSLRPPTIHRTDSNISQASSVGEKSKRFGKKHVLASSKDKEKKSNDELTTMMKRANDYIALGYVRIPSMVLCLSYRSGKGQHHHFVPDVHDLVFRMPTLEYRNKTWSTMDLVVQLRKEVTRGLVSHAGAIMGNLFHSHKVSKIQQGRLRDLANSSVLLGKNKTPMDSSSMVPSDTTSSRDLSIVDYEDEDEDRRPRSSFASSRNGNYPASMTSSTYADSQKSGLNTNGSQNHTPPSASRRPRTAATSAPAGESYSSPSHSSFMTPAAKRRSRATSVESEKSRRSSVLGVGRRLSVMASKLRDSSAGDEDEGSRHRSRIPKFLHGKDKDSTPTP